ncbi:transcriptional regulator, LysR family [Cnuella takakiae]|uniref:Transcriptional regulator, LysR family n=1 Tax=Cnuella takakiae TaxID=1302690 RepID=A0A1M4ZC08_9BACT|nr:LysR family transcriptional regulator [Cnuella takakiae]OLY94258.1 LysR family transcriptional regulator [Cnuella takakiae]SHF15579.1 transcriptional regulator, LysR family [Cnuella takakiae]
MDLEQIRSFLTLAQELHFWNASEKLFITQSALSRQIKGLEQDLGIQLFERNNRNVKLTKAGTFLQEQWTRLSEEIDRVHRQAKNIHEGTFGLLRVAYPGSIAFGFLPTFITAIANELPDVKLELVEPTDVSFEQLLLNYQLDLALRRDPAENPALHSVVLYSEHFALIVPETHPLRADNFKDLTQVKDERFILSGLHHKTYYVSCLRELFRTYGFKPNVHIESDFGGMILSLVAKGLGISIMPSSYASNAPAGVRFINLPNRTNLYAAWRKDDNNTVLKNVTTILQTVAEGFQSFSKDYNA